MEPFRAFVADLLPEEQHARGFAVQSLFISMGAGAVSALPWILSHLLGISAETTSKARIPSTVRYPFYLGALAFLGAVLWTAFSTREHPPADLSAFAATKARRHGFSCIASEILDAIRTMPLTMRQLIRVQVCTGLGVFCMGIYFIPAVAYNVFGAPNEESNLYAEGIEWGGLCYSVASLVTFITAFGLVAASRNVRPKQIHSVCLFCGAISLISVGAIHHKHLLLLPMIGIGIATASILSMPYALLAPCLPVSQLGVYMGIFNLSIVLPEVAASLGLGWIMNAWLHNDRALAVMAGGVSMLLAAVFMQCVNDGRNEPSMTTLRQTNQ